LQYLLTDVDCGINAVHQGINQYLVAFKANKGKDQDTPTYQEAMNGSNREEIEPAMSSEIKELEDHKTWIENSKVQGPQGCTSATVDVGLPNKAIS
jgi:hypothetical protein